MQSFYSLWGSRLHLPLEDDLADAYNTATKNFQEAQARYEEENGAPWTPDQPLTIEWNERLSKAWDSIAKIVNLLVEVNGGGLDIPEEDCTSDYLIKL